MLTSQSSHLPPFFSNSHCFTLWELNRTIKTEKNKNHNLTIYTSQQQKPFGFPSLQPHPFPFYWCSSSFVIFLFLNCTRELVCSTHCLTLDLTELTVMRVFISAVFLFVFFSLGGESSFASDVQMTFSTSCIDVFRWSIFVFFFCS